MIDPKYLEEVNKADSPEKYQSALICLFQEIQADCYDSAESCVSAWQDATSGIPWRSLGGRIGNFVRSLERFTL